MKKIFGLILALLMIVCITSDVTVNCLVVSARGSAPYGIKNNGLGGIYININEAPYSTLNSPNAYDKTGCAWFASARVKQLTGKCDTYWSGTSWYNSQYATYGFSRGQSPQAGSLICWSNHVAVLEKIEGNTAYISQGGDTYRSSAEYGYCAIDTYSLSSIKSISSSTFLGYVYLGISGGGGSSLGNPVDFGTDFYTYIFNQPCWKTVACEPNGTNVYLETEKWTANQRWYATKNSDGSYTFKNAKNNKCLDVNGAYDINGTNIKTYDYNGTDAQKWFIYLVDGRYVFMPKCSRDKVLDLTNAGTSDGTNVQLYERNGSDAQAFTLYKVENCMPEKPKVRADREYIYGKDTITFSWDSTEYTDQYLYYLTEYPEGFAYTTNTYNGTTAGNSVSFSNLTSGKYSFFAHAVSHQGKWGDQSNWISFNVYAEDYTPIKTMTYNNHIYALYDYEMSWSFARDLCTDLGGHLVTVTSSGENAAVTNFIQYGNKDAYWLGAYDYERGDKNYAWVTGETFSYNNWSSGEPSSSGTYGEKEHFAEVRKSYGNKWNDVNNISKSNKGFILEVDAENIKPVTTKTYGSNTYMLFDKNTTWTEAKQHCEMLGGHLATINSDAENQFIKDFLQSGSRKWYYLGAQKVNNVWKWVDGKNYSNITWNASASRWTGTHLMMYKEERDCVGLNNAYFPISDIKKIGYVCEIENTVPTPKNDKWKINSYSGGKVSVTAPDDVAGGQSINVFVAKYDSTGKFIDCTNTKFTTTAGQTEYNLSTKNISGGKIKVMLWDDKQKPLTNYLNVE